jgi:hypothetical protein
MNGQGQVLLEVVALRNGTEYQEAERLRRRIGSSKAMAESLTTSDEYAAVRLLIGTWDSIAKRVRAGDIQEGPFFESNPVQHMWDALQGGIVVIRKRSKGPRYAEDFQWLVRKLRGWLKKPANRKFRTASVEGINAHFG